jgi:membrane protein implicated in regulation of membrane protease activity
MFDQMGRLLVGLGLMLVLFGVLVIFVGKFGAGRLPGDIVYRKGNFTFYFPLVSSILLSVLLTALLWVFRRR